MGLNHAASQAVDDIVPTSHSIVFHEFCGKKRVSSGSLVCALSFHWSEQSCGGQQLHGSLEAQRSIRLELGRLKWS